jgi:hypothetical protein
VSAGFLRIPLCADGSLGNLPNSLAKQRVCAWAFSMNVHLFGRRAAKHLNTLYIMADSGNSCSANYLTSQYYFSDSLSPPLVCLRINFIHRVIPSLLHVRILLSSRNQYLKNDTRSQRQIFANHTGCSQILSEIVTI